VPQHLAEQLLAKWQSA